ncbi:hypothetical protein [Parasitella parasitica]|uniref:C2H2-type domain-containing protein n=1 Tax=Parasitella parasitica TaxID=35722 RepID=A0A0B7NWJ7_9FUNG|nr:hypothetical protein [Parasitella parasitica]
MHLELIQLALTSVTPPSVKAAQIYIYDLREERAQTTAMNNHHVNHCYYGVNQDVGAKNSNQTQDHAFAANTGVSPFTTSCYTQHLPSPPLEQQKESLWYNQNNPYYQQQHQINRNCNGIPFTYSYNNEIASPQELVLFNLLQDQQQNHQKVRCHDNQLIQYDDQEPSLSKWALVPTNFQQNNLNGGALPLSPKSMQSTDNFDSSPIIDVSCFAHRIHLQTNPLVVSHLSLPPPQRQYYNHQLTATNAHPSIVSSQSSNKSDKSQEIAQMQYQFQQQFHQTEGQQQEHEESKQQQSKQYKKTTRKRASRSQLQCTTCFKTFSRPYNLKSHQRTHTKERPFLCLYPDCGWTFARPHDLKRHELLHSGIKPFQCVCGKRFARSDAYKRHQSVDIKCAISVMPQQRKRKRRSDAFDNQAP